jgi:MoaA/NifB/PqqE/SkfB family radical SAM enzyme
VHGPEIVPPSAATTPEDVNGVLNFLWLELTNRCNLQCIHCYTESGPHTGGGDILTPENYEDLMSEAHGLGCKKIQFIGGEPQLNPQFKRLLRFSTEVGFDFIEVFSNLTKLDEETLEISVENGVHFATSVYSDDPVAHDRITTVPGSHRRTIGNLRRLVDRGVPARAAIISMDNDREATARTGQFLRGLGASVGGNRSTEVREFGRGQEVVGKSESMDRLCGHCWNGNLAVAPNGNAMPCVMARQWPVGNVLENSLGDILNSDALRATRRQIYERAWMQTACEPFCMQSCGPDLSCPCNPLLCQQSCAPWDAQ